MTQLNRNPAAAIVGMGTALPAYSITQPDIAELIASSLQDRPDLARFARRVFKSCGVETRYTCDDSYLGSAENCRYLPSGDKGHIPATEERMKKYQQEAPPLGLEAAARALRDAGQSAGDITHLITVSCTGQYLPGLDVELIRQLGLPPRVNRLPLIFQGCAAGLKAIQLARDVVLGTPGSRVLVVCVELCTLHFQPVKDRGALLAASFFGDGAAACVIAAPEAHHTHYLDLGRGYSVLLPDTTEDMTWEVGDTGFDLYLSPRIPELLGIHLEAELAMLLGDTGRPELWAVHPGGRGIVDSVQSVMQLSDEETRYSREILRTAGNLSSVTILFVLESMRQDMRAKESSARAGVAMAFGPGLTAELMRFSYVPAYTPSAKEQDHAIL
ncbi:type III polyketide synthase ['Paenibacillus yunnanensis' Narsing Rao et al. 2020]|uniref:type III polyketide synthase n=1 Tax=Paenibacillus tengchongensis TaxID=2608684 RepID=UPI00124E03C3|nr:type III polyketide synthase [Paenibacillus tengchongensis]